MRGTVRAVAAALALAVLAACAAGSLARPAAPMQALPSLVSDADYPLAALRYEQEGRVSVVLSVHPAGRVDGCRVTQSSGHSVLDASTCRILVSRARFRAARDAKGEAIASEYPAAIKWVLPGAAAPVG